MSMPALYASGDPTIIEANLKHAQRGDLPPAVALHRKKSGDFIDVELSSDAITFNHAPALLALASDITESLRAERGLAQASQRLHHLAFYDALTQLPNRLLFLDRLQHVLASSALGKLSGALLFLDLDNFKAINDSFGHEAGDLLLQQVASRLKACVDAGATVARLGADEFVIMLEHLDGQTGEAAIQAVTVAERTLAAVSAPYRVAQHDCFCTGCVGISLFGKPEDKPGDLLKQADLAMHRAKGAGRNALRFFDPEMQAAASARAELEAQLRHALEKQQFRLFYQPQVDWKGRVTGAEALVRWQHPGRGLIMPAQFIPLAEETGLILDLGYVILKEACEQLAAWSRRSETAPLSVAVNISARQFRHASFVEQVKHIVAASGADPRKLRLELTESMLVENIEDTIENMRSLRETGVRFSLDDFGTGYSSLLYLKRLPLESLKIDRSFVRDILSDSNDAAIVRTVISLGQSLGLGVIAEGVEQESQRNFLEQLGCGHYQGYLFSPALPTLEFEAFVQRQASPA